MIASLFIPISIFSMAKRFNNPLYNYYSYLLVTFTTFFMPFTQCMLLRLNGTPDYALESNTACAQLIVSAYFNHIEEKIAINDTAFIIKLMAGAYEMSNETDGMTHQAILATIFTISATEILNLFPKFGMPILYHHEYITILYFVSLVCIILGDCWTSSTFKYHSIAALAFISLVGSTTPSQVHLNMDYVKHTVGLPPPAPVPSITYPDVTEDLLVFDTNPNPQHVENDVHY